VLLPMPAVDLQALLNPLAADGQGDDANGDQDGDGIPNSEDPDYEPPDTAGDESIQTVGYCVTAAALQNLSPALVAIYEKSFYKPFSSFANIQLPDGTTLRDSPAVKPECR